jgi:hypothetical protein
MLAGAQPTWGCDYAVATLQLWRRSLVSAITRLQAAEEVDEKHSETTMFPNDSWRTSFLRPRPAGGGSKRWEDEGVWLDAWRTVLGRWMKKAC